MERHVFDPNQPQGSMSLLNLRNALRALFQMDLMPLRPKASWLLDDMEYSSDANAQADWSGTGVTVGNSTTKYNGSYALELVIDVTGDRKVTRSRSLDLSSFKYIKLWERVNVASSVFQFYIRDNAGNESYWNITSNGTQDTWQEDTLNLTTPDSNNGTPAGLSTIVQYGFLGLDASKTYLIDDIKALCGLNVAIDTTNIGSYYKNIYVLNQPLEMVAKSSPLITPPSANPRIDILTVDSAGTLAWVTGTEASSPVAPWANLAVNKIPICLVYCKTTMAKVVDYEDKDANPNEGYLYSDVRPFIKLGAMTFLNLTDTPDSYSGQQGKGLTVKATEDGLEFGTVTEFRSNDCMNSANTTPPSGWTDISGTYNGKMVRISSGTPLATGGDDTFTLTEANLPPHTHTGGTTGAGGDHTHTMEIYRVNTFGANYSGYESPSIFAVPGQGLNLTGWVNDGYSPTYVRAKAPGTHTHSMGSSGSVGSGTAVSHVPAHVQLRLFKKN